MLLTLDMYGREPIVFVILFSACVYASDCNGQVNPKFLQPRDEKSFEGNPLYENVSKDGETPPMIEIDPVWVPPATEDDKDDPFYQEVPPLIAIDPIWVPPSTEDDKDDPFYQEVPPLIAIDPIWVPPSNGDTGDVVNPPSIEVDPVWISDSLKHDPEDEIKTPSRREGTCTIGTKNSNELSMDQPILVDPYSGRIIQPSPTGVIELPAGDIMTMYCTGSFIPPLSGKKLTATCVEGKVFEVDGRNFEITQIHCSGMAAHLLRKTTRRCYDYSVIVEIGFAVVDDFFPLLEICHNEKKQVTHYSHYQMGPYNTGYQSGIPRPLFMTGGFFNGADVNTLYTQVQQKRMVDTILGYDSSKYFDTSRDVYMARGHMCAKVDFVYAPAQWATFYFLNTAPQWQTFNGGNWERVENGVRTMVGDRNVHLDVYTGTWGVMTLPDINGVQKELYLAFDENGNGLIPVPKIYYRVIIDLDTRLGIVLIGVNNIHATMEELEEEYIICTDVGDQLDWVPWDKNNLLKGYSYACEVNEFAAKIGELPPLEVSGLFL